MKRCTYCGRESEDGAPDCRDCGTRFADPPDDRGRQGPEAVQKGLLPGLKSRWLVGFVGLVVLLAVAVLAVMLTLEWRLTLISIVIMPLFILVARRLGGRLRDIAREALEANAQMNAMMNETLNIGGALLVKLFGRAGAATRSPASTW